MNLPASGRRVLVSGASRGLGRAVAQAFAANGDRVAVHFGSRAEEARTTLASLAGTGHTLVGGDLADPAGAVTVVDTAAEALGGIDVLVNNAAVNLRHPLPDTPYEEWVAVWQQHVSVNLLATANLSHLAARRMIDQGSGGRIVNIGSRGAFRGEPDHPAYGATKAAVHALGQSLAVSLAPYGIAVASVAPGFFATERVSSRLEGAEGAAIRAQSPFDRVAEPAEIAAAVLWLASPAAEWSSGTILDLNGASHLRS
ncbi:MULTISPECIES: SDR family NAD(P)-dependent oxidoreductase [Streptomyces]|uniref:3-oxoacyl-[acyl-carrier protein] reductase n=1 Tax=Streptomyces venezuelae (strain ATCC 10712 / CBS 650.69 / DSM 40230 / JCM 4526 / NBRC 13096 / PD 04745) TaxID=953739 RepID=F2R4C9_STRVP|nr:SDR family oxidoreductase [Streptomyces venezuelae]APE19629.1 3-oxoacyl-ACP reductase [Streptomyces venezuelae]QER97045.1 SDR family oxidoreductase [Streptomyces venezuelae ATCC 10712]QES04231.1 SDR family oxidoreductase [Streptomyces venezuelae]CCA53406.1 3-oxoacyl-[acyl-carrier protein] reductase [Streptomyces venezuelae ATCC 10712]